MMAQCAVNVFREVQLKGQGQEKDRCLSIADSINSSMFYVKITLGLAGWVNWNLFGFTIVMNDEGECVSE